MKTRPRRCSWKLASLRDEAVRVEEVGGVPLNGVRLDEASDMLSKASARLLKLSEMVERACFEIKVFVIESTRTVRGAEAKT